MCGKMLTVFAFYPPSHKPFSFKLRSEVSIVLQRPLEQLHLSLSPQMKTILVAYAAVQLI